MSSPSSVSFATTNSAIRGAAEIPSSSSSSKLATRLFGFRPVRASSANSPAYHSPPRRSAILVAHSTRPSSSTTSSGSPDSLSCICRSFSCLSSISRHLCLATSSAKRVFLSRCSFRSPFRPPTSPLSPSHLFDTSSNSSKSSQPQIFRQKRTSDSDCSSMLFYC